ncbi:MAG: Hsp70 family protein [Chloroflexi bacterium]|nr:Hsp70 family protein [Chloroflexota bacterium]MBU1751899.1 Hsp70 family protein [Chloroflexota bacterium]
MTENGLVLVPISPGVSNPAIVPSVLFFEPGFPALVGYPAVESYVTRTAGQLVVPLRVVQPQIIETVFGGEYVQFDVAASPPGRFFHTLKRSLVDASFEGTRIGEQVLRLEDLVALILRALKDRADAHFGHVENAVLLGRPVRFSQDPTADALAEARLRRAAELAGFTDIQFLYEPLGAAWHYRQQVRRAETALVFDFGGGTLDFSVIRWAGPGDAGSVLGVGGLLVGGTTLNEDLMEQRLLGYFGAAVTWQGQLGKRLPLPRHIFDHLRSWHTVHQLNQRELMAFLQEVQRVASEPAQVAALISLVARNYGWDLFMVIEAAKCALSDVPETILDFQRPAIDIYERITRREFEQVIAPRLRQIERGLYDTLDEAGITVTDVDVVLCTGGSGLIPSVQRLLARLFGEARIVRQEAFTSVVSGLAAAAAAAAGEM